MPRPITKQVAATCQTELAGGEQGQQHRADEDHAEPISAVLRKPIRR